MDHPIIVIGAGIAGIVAAIHLEEAGYEPLILEGADRVGGRVKTDLEDGFRLDHGFQVLLTGYQEAQHYLDFDALDLKKFDPGAIIYKQGHHYKVIDPMRQPSRIATMLFSSVGTVKDKFLIWKLAQSLKKVKAEAVFQREVQPAIQFLREYGFSEKIIDNFFRPFFGGIFLENELTTSANMFRFVFKMFSQGYAAIPRLGMEQIPVQLKEKLSKSTFRFQTRVASVEGNEVRLEGGESIPFQKLLIATDPHNIVPGLKGQQMEYVNTCNLYYSADRPILEEPTIALVADAESLINNFCVMTEVSEDYSERTKILISVTLKDIPGKRVEEKVADELKALTGRPDIELHFLARYDIPKALPVLEGMRYDLLPAETRLTESIFLAGDYLLNASLDAAMRSGRRAAQALLDSIGKVQME